jgi:hypothetical protein
MGASSPLLLRFGDSRVDLSPSLVTSLALPIENVILFLASAKRNKSRFLPTARRAKIRIVPAPIARGSNKTPDNKAHPSRVPDRQSAAIRLMAQAAQPEVGVCSSEWQKAHELAPLVFSILVETKGYWPSMHVPSPTLVYKRFSHGPIRTGIPVANPCLKSAIPQDVTRRAGTDPLIHSLNEFVYCPSLRRFGHERQQIYLIPLLLSQSRFMALADSD